MPWLLTLLIGVLLGAPASATPVAPVPFAEWEARAGSQLLIDTEKNMGYLFDSNGDYTTFRVATGQRRFVYYIGRGYNAATPEREWVVRDEDIKGDRITFGPSGRFLRLFYKDEGTPYGIHTHRSGDRMLADEERFKSMGCIIVSEEVFNLLEKIFTLNGNELKVTTSYGLQKLLGEKIAAANFQN